MNWEYFYAADAPYVKVLSWPHILYLLVCFVTVFLFVKNHEVIRRKKDFVGKLLLGILLFQQIFLMYGWYAVCTDRGVKESLPLELCRVSSILTIYYLLRQDNRVMDVIYSFSIYALIALFYPLNVYHFAHINGISYMINHLMTVLIPIFGAIAYNWKPSWKGFIRAAVSFTVYLPVVIVVNKLTGGNYFYLINRPFLNGMPGWIYNSLAYIVTITGFALVTWIILLIIQKWQTKNKK